MDEVRRQPSHKGRGYAFGRRLRIVELQAGRCGLWSTRTWCFSRGGNEAQLKLAKLPDRTPVKVTISISPELRQALGAYADMYREAYGEIEKLEELIPAMLAQRVQSNLSMLAGFSR